MTRTSRRATPDCSTNGPRGGPRGLRHRLHGWRSRVLRRCGDAGMSTAEYAVGTIAACAFAAVLYKVVTSGPVSEALQQLVERALDATF